MVRDDGGEKKENSTRGSDFLTEQTCMPEDRQDDLILGRRYIFDTEHKILAVNWPRDRISVI